MSRELTIAAVTVAIRDLIENGIGEDLGERADGLTVTALHPGLIGADGTRQINLFLYQIKPDEARRNATPGGARSDGTGFRSAPLTLRYLLTVYGMNEVDSQDLLGRTMSVLAAHPVLSRAPIAASAGTTLPSSDSEHQSEPIRITLVPAGLDELGTLWLGLQTPYRLSVAYEASHLVIASSRPTRVPPPVLTPGMGSQGTQPRPIPGSSQPGIESSPSRLDSGSGRSAATRHGPARSRLGAIARRLTPEASWHDLILPDEPMRQLRQIAEEWAHRGTVYERWGFGARMKSGKGISVLFAGESGTGKTMAAEVLARSLQLSLYRVDLSAVTSKYIGETEKNLGALFAAAEGEDVILLLDEADALLGKRPGDVRDSHDRYANLDATYLLGRMEEYSGLVILAVNQRSAIDAKFVRRLRHVVEFPFPSARERRRMWEQAFTAATPMKALEYERLARLELTGGQIQAVALRAAFLAAGAKTEITTPLLLAAAREECRKLARAVNAGDFASDGE